MSELLLQTRNLTKQYGRHRAVDDVNMHIKRVRYMALLEETEPVKQPVLR